MRFILSVDGKKYKIETKQVGEKFSVSVDGKHYFLSLEEYGEANKVTIGDKSYTIKINGDLNKEMNVLVNEKEYKVKVERLIDEDLPASLESAGLPRVKEVKEEKEKIGGITAPMPGKILSIKVKEGDQVKVGDVLLILEAMKMENEIASNINGTVREIRVSNGSSVETGDVLVIID